MFRNTVEESHPHHPGSGGRKATCAISDVSSKADILATYAASGSACSDAAPDDAEHGDETCNYADD